MNVPATKPRIKRYARRIQIGLAVLGFIVTWGGSKLSSPTIENLGYGILGMAILFEGVEALATREISFAVGTSSIFETYRGVAAISWGVIFSEWGLIFIAFAVLRQFEMLHTAVSFLCDRPGIALISAGLMLVCLGAMIVFGHAEGDSSLLTSLAALPLRMFGLLPLLMGVALIAAGFMEIAAPALFDNLLPHLPDFPSSPIR